MIANGGELKTHKARRVLRTFISPFKPFGGPDVVAIEAFESSPLVKMGYSIYANQ